MKRNASQQPFIVDDKLKEPCRFLKNCILLTVIFHSTLGAGMTGKHCSLPSCWYPFLVELPREYTKCDLFVPRPVKGVRQVRMDAGRVDRRHDQTGVLFSCTKKEKVKCILGNGSVDGPA